MIKKIKKRFGHWSFKYIFNRLCLVIVEVIHPDWPWLTRDSILLLDKLLKKTDKGLEFGSGRSTSWLATRLQNLISIESDQSWFNKVKKKLAENNINNVEYRLEKNETYTQILDNVRDEYFDFVLIDGFARDLCALKSLPRLKSGGIMVIDNIDRYVPNNNHKSLLHRVDFDSKIWAQLFQKELSNWRRIWTTNGVTDTLILFKP